MYITTAPMVIILLLNLETTQKLKRMNSAGTGKSSTTATSRKKAKKEKKIPEVQDQEHSDIEHPMKHKIMKPGALQSSSSSEDSDNEALECEREKEKELAKKLKNIVS